LGFLDGGAVKILTLGRFLGFRSWTIHRVDFARCGFAGVSVWQFANCRKSGATCGRCQIVRLGFVDEKPLKD
jgi:hypothetical protein